VIKTRWSFPDEERKAAKRSGGMTLAYQPDWFSAFCLKGRRNKAQGKRSDALGSEAALTQEP
jgi:hypothetical protein